MKDSNVNFGGQSFRLPGWLKLVLGIGIPLLLVAGVGLWWFNTTNEIRKHGNYLEQTLLIPGYKAAQTSLDTCISTSMQAANIADAQAEKFKDTLSAVVHGRYNSESESGSAFSAVVEDYPDMAGFNAAFDRAFNTAIGCRKDFKTAQDSLQQKVATFDTWRNGDWTVVHFGGGNFPNELLVIDTANGPKTGAEALAQIRRMVLSKDTRESFDTGTREDKPLFTTAPAPAK
jgi:hypothetical protein